MVKNGVSGFHQLFISDLIISSMDDNSVAKYGMILSLFTHMKSLIQVNEGNMLV